MSAVVSTVALQFSGWSPVFLHVLNNVYHWVLSRYSVGLLCIDYRCDYVASEVADPTARRLSSGYDCKFITAPPIYKKRIKMFVFAVPLLWPSAIAACPLQEAAPYIGNRCSGLTFSFHFWLRISAALRSTATTSAAEKMWNLCGEKQTLFI